MVKEPKMCVVLCLLAATRSFPPCVRWMWCVPCTFSTLTRVYYQSGPLESNMELLPLELFPLLSPWISSKFGLLQSDFYFSQPFSEGWIVCRIPSMTIKKDAKLDPSICTHVILCGFLVENCLHIPHLIYYYYRILTCSFKRLILGSIN